MLSYQKRIDRISGMLWEKRMQTGEVLFYYGEGHGKTTAAIGSAIRAASEGKTVTVIQFLKAKNERVEEFFGRLEPEIKYFRFAKADPCFCELTEEQKQEEISNLKNGFNYGKKVISTGGCDLVVLDEILGLVDLGVVSSKEVHQMLETKPEDMEIICTGRKLADDLREFADKIYNIAPEK